MMPVNVAAVSYLNTVPFLHGLKRSAAARYIRLSLAPPAQCAAMIESRQADIALTPVAAIPALNNATIITDYCLGAIAPVRTVVLLSDTPLEAIRTIYLDPDSRTSSALVRLLAANYWRIGAAFAPLTVDAFPIKQGEGCVMIGDKVFSHERQFLYRYDLAEAWIRFTGTPFVFAAWVAVKPLPEAFLRLFNEALGYGVGHICEAVAAEAPAFDAALAFDYLTNNIHYRLDEDKHRGMKHFLNYELRITNYDNHSLDKNRNS
ncbi:MAG: menaquinone biosynthesis protein [Prevotellaceae bacterium]|jgi:chorismate dehydratase|nr:menaquinone biosynthesis protein [Prevotellaceae bacterium]